MQKCRRHQFFRAFCAAIWISPQNFITGENVGLITIRRSRGKTWREIFLSKEIISGSTTISSLDINYFFPLYLYPEEKQTRLDGQISRKPNLNTDIVKIITEKTGLCFTSEKTDDADTFASLDLLDYIYAILHSPTYRTKFHEFLKIDFPRVPYPIDKKQFCTLAKLGAELRTLHLMESDKLNHLIITYPAQGDNTVTRRIVADDYEITNAKKRLGKVWINDQQYFGDIPESTWNFYIGGYQPAQKYLKDRKGRTLTHEDIMHYQKIIVAQTETAKVMARIDKNQSE